ncbi:hypothetical protein [Puniceibacterium sp. IMCC21224]|uniref:hypothetical protein n=1 Tax=Puniceibacterium sp. IMCC21224 TaxID=1618204 RepID=UPI00065D7D6A|nr:hypothetical protein [Puniceibacterium sp. IMCC21224]KMK67257.1 hypothetical protein IMCC21224_112124 [Puniceibacterium sp. IMCC21224]
MASYLLSYDLNGPTPSHKEMDDLIRSISSKAGRVLETVWWVDYAGSAAQLRDRLLSTLRNEDRLFVCACKEAA